MGQGLSSPVTTQHVERHITSTYRAAVNHVCGFRESQEDAHTIEHDVNGCNLAIISVYDGHGGAQCSKWLQENFHTYFKDIGMVTDQDDEAPFYFLENAEYYEGRITKLMYDIDEAFLEWAEPRDFEDGSTATITLIQPWNLLNDKAWVQPLNGADYDDLLKKGKIGYKIIAVNIGDSRSILISNPLKNTRDVYDYLTEDHKPTDPEERQRIVQSGGMVQNARVDGSLALSRAFGDVVYKVHSDYNSWRHTPPEERRVCVTPTFSESLARPGDVLVVACDGIFESEFFGRNAPVPHVVHYMVNQLTEKYKDSPRFRSAAFDPAIITRNLIMESIAYGSKDNHTAIVAVLGQYPDAELDSLDVIKSRIVSKDVYDALGDDEEVEVNGEKFVKSEVYTQADYDALVYIKEHIDPLPPVAYVPSTTWRREDGTIDGRMEDAILRDLDNQDVWREWDENQIALHIDRRIRERRVTDVQPPSQKAGIAPPNERMQKIPLDLQIDEDEDDPLHQFAQLKPICFELDSDRGMNGPGVHPQLLQLLLAQSGAQDF